MFIKLTTSKKSKYTKVYLVEGYRDENGKSKQRTIKKYGNLEALKLKDPNILDKLKAEARNMKKNEVIVTHNLLKSNSKQEKDKNYGYFFLDSIYKNLAITEFLESYNFETKFKYDLDEILKLLTFSRILNPMSKKATVENQDAYFEAFNVDLKSVYKSLSNCAEMKIDLQNHLNERVSAAYGRDASLVFYDVTNYYFETEIEDDLKKKGPSKEKKSTPIVGMGLLIDSNGLPIAYDLFPGNTHDSSTLIPFIENMRKQYSFGRVILTADKALNSGKNLAYLKSKNDGYIVSQKIRGMSKTFINEVLSEEGYACNAKGTFKIKSFLRDRETKDENGKNVILKEKVVCFWSKDYDDREKHKREKLEERIAAYLESPAKLKSSNSYGIKKYLKLQNIDTETGEIEDIEPYVEFDQEKYNRDVSLDGYYAIVSSELNLSNEDIIKKYRGLWKIEESFRVLKTDLEGRPVYVKTPDHVEGHFLICFIALLISRILEMKLDNKYSIRRIQKSLADATCRKIGNGLYSLNKQDETFRSLDYSKVRLEQLRDWKKILRTT
ncbi:IS1634 family transposase [Alkaliphilus transvaalensis]|nr:IS1634 family transposase [Alkaliphilus transvaalensis]